MSKTTLISFLLLLAVCAARPLLPTASTHGTTPSTAVDEDWAFQRWLPAATRPVRLPLTPVEMHFASGFPGQIGRFSEGNSVWVVRHMNRATRMLHPAEDCFRGLGYQVSNAHVVKQSATVQWRCFTAERDRRLQVCERMFDRDGRQWTDVSSWYWSALLQGDGEWWALTYVIPLEDKS